jgi:hypothetical protein
MPEDLRPAPGVAGGGNGKAGPDQEEPPVPGVDDGQRGLWRGQPRKPARRASRSDRFQPRARGDLSSRAPDLQHLSPPPGQQFQHLAAGSDRPAPAPVGRQRLARLGGLQRQLAPDARAPRPDSRPPARLQALLPHLLVQPGEQASRPQHPVRGRPQAARNIISPQLGVRDRRTAVPGQGSELLLRQPGSPAPARQVPAHLRPHPPRSLRAGADPPAAPSRGRARPPVTTPVPGTHHRPRPEPARIGHPESARQALASTGTGPTGPRPPARQALPRRLRTAGVPAARGARPHGLPDSQITLFRPQQHCDT